MVKTPPAVQENEETWVRSLGWEDPLKEGMATHSSSLAWTEEPGATVHGVAKSQTRLKRLSTHTLAELVGMKPLGGKKKKKNSTELTGDFPGGPVAKTLHSQCKRPGFHP